MGADEEAAPCSRELAGTRDLERLPGLVAGAGW